MNMATAVEQGQQESDAQLEAAVAQLDKEIERVQVDLADWRSQSQDANDGLQQLEEEYAKACTALAQKKGGVEEPSKIQGRMQVLKDRLVGITNVITERESALNALRAEIANLHAEQSQRTQARLVVEEKEQTDALITDAEQALTTRDGAAKRFFTAIIALRSRRYVGELARRAAFDAAQSLERRGAGMRA
jgi:chromosome segregation ATPase